MSQREPSIFDLSPAEKLQLVEDLWDDLAGTPEAVPVHGWNGVNASLNRQFHNRDDLTS